MQKSTGSQNMAKVSSFLGLDFGKAKIGIAIADSETKIAFAFGVLKNDKNFQTSIGVIIQRENISKIIIGITRHAKDRQGEEEKMNFGKELEKNCGIPVEFSDEMFSTKMAHANIKMRGGKNIAQFDDQEAARIILQGWLDESAF